MSLERKLLRSKERLENKLKEKQERRDRLGKEIFDFPNMTIPLCLVTFAPAFFIVAIASFFTKTFMPIRPFSLLWTAGGVLSAFSVRKLSTQWFTHYGDKTILKGKIKPNKESLPIFLLCSAIIIAVCLTVKNMLAFNLYVFLLSVVCVYIALHKNGYLWDMPPLMLLGFKKYEFSPQNSDNHAMRNGSYKCVIRNYNKTKEDNTIEGTFIGRSWFYLREETGKEKTK